MIMAIRMTHPDHGTTYAVGAEVEWNIKNGWKIEAKEKTVIQPTVEPEVTEQKRRGRPPK